MAVAQQVDEFCVEKLCCGFWSLVFFSFKKVLLHNIYDRFVCVYLSNHLLRFCFVLFIWLQWNFAIPHRVASCLSGYYWLYPSGIGAQLWAVLSFCFYMKRRRRYDGESNDATSPCPNKIGMVLSLVQIIKLGSLVFWAILLVW